MNSGAGAEDYALDPSLLFRQIGRVCKVVALVIRNLLSSSLTVVILRVQSPDLVVVVLGIGMAGQKRTFGNVGSGGDN